MTQNESGSYKVENGRICRSTNQSRPGGPEIWFRIVHAAVHGQNGTRLATYREQEVKVAFGPMGVLEDFDVGTLMRRIDAHQLVSVVPLTRDNLKPPTSHKSSHVIELLRKAIEWRRQLDTGEVRNQAAIARREGITRARVTQVMGLLRLAAETREQILTMSDIIRRSAVTERRLRPMINRTDGASHVGPTACLMP